MRGIPSSVTDIRKKVFTEVARLAYDGAYDRMEKLPYIIVPGEEAKYRESIFLERAIAGERVRLAMGLPLRPVDQHTVLSDGVTESAVAEKYKSILDIRYTDSVFTVQTALKLPGEARQTKSAPA